MEIRRIMNKAVIWCAANDTVDTAAKLMREHGVGTLPVLEDSDSRRVIGIVTDRDLCVKVVASGLDPRFVEVQECMNRRVIACYRSTDAVTALEHMTKGRVRRMPVLSRLGALIGIVSIDDLARSGMVPAENIRKTLALLAKPSVKRLAKAA